MVELLAPAGSYDALVAAVQCGADAIYLGGKEFNARSSALNFSREELKRAVEYSHLYGVKLYVTMNILYSDDMFEGLYDFLTYLYEIQIDGLIIQDLGFIKFVNEYFPDFDIHVSTQASIKDLDTAKYYESIDHVSRIVLARENTVEEIKDICEHTSLDVEIFVHGAYCVCYSGQCLMSSYIAHRSGNKGECGQPCRLQWTLEKDHQALEHDFVLSPKDICTIDHVGELIEAGVQSFKIEGRMKRPEYVGMAVRAYRKAIDDYYDEIKDHYDQEKEDMQSMFSRGYSNGYIFHDRKIMAKDFSGNRGIRAGKVVYYKNKRVGIELERELSQNDRIVFSSSDEKRTITKLYKKGKLINHEDKGIVEIEYNQFVKKNTVVYKIYDFNKVNEIQSYIKDNPRKVYVAITVEGVIGDYFYLTMDDGINCVSVSSDVILQKAKTSQHDRIIEQVLKFGNTIYEPVDLTDYMDDDIFIPVKQINDMRRRCCEQLNTLRSQYIIHQTSPKAFINKPDVMHRDCKKLYVQIDSKEQYDFIKDMNIDKIIVPYKLYDELSDIRVIPYLSFFDHTQHVYDEVMISNLGQKKNGKHCIYSEEINCYNSYVDEESDIVLSTELNKEQITSLQMDAKKILLAYGKVAVMKTKYCPVSYNKFGYKKDHCNLCKTGSYVLKDRYNKEFELKQDDYCNTYIYHYDPLYIDSFLDANVDAVLLRFINEENIVSVIQDYMNILHTGKSKNSKKNVGYFYDLS